MGSKKTTLLLPVFLIVVGIGWLLTTIGVAPGIDWIWTLGLTAAGAMAFVLGGFNKVTVVVGPFFILAGSLSILRQTDRLSLDVETPVLVITAGILLLCAHLPSVPTPDWVLPESKPNKTKEGE